jgi:DNA-directed RNA polymerase beta' subunit
MPRNRNITTEEGRRIEAFERCEAFCDANSRITSVLNGWDAYIPVIPPELRPQFLLMVVVLHLSLNDLYVVIIRNNRLKRLLGSKP